MRAGLVGLAIAATVGTACFYPRRSDEQAHRAAYAVDALVIVTGVVVAASADFGRGDCGDCDPDMRAVVAGVGLGIAGVGALGSLVNVVW